MLRALSYPAVLALVSLICTLIGCKPHTTAGLVVPSKSTIDASALRSAPLPTLEGHSGAPSLLITAGLSGYTEPCGCTEDILQGGIDRLVGTVRAIDAAHTSPLIFINAGDTLFPFTTVEDTHATQDALRLELLQRAFKRADLAVLGVGPRDLSRGLEIFEEFAVKTLKRVVSTNARPHETSQNDLIWTPARLLEIDGMTLAFLNIITPSALEESPAFDALDLQPHHEALREALHQADVRAADMRVLFAHGEEHEIADLLTQVDGVDVVISSSQDAPTDSVGSFGSASAITLWSQGRELGILSLSDIEPTAANREAHADELQDASDADSNGTDNNSAEKNSAKTKNAKWSNARGLSNDDRDTLETLIENVEAQIATLKKRAGDGEAPPLLKTLEARKSGYASELAADDTRTAPAFDSGERQFLWTAISLSPGLPEDADIQTARRAYNRALQEINLQGATPPKNAAEGTPTYIGAQSCASCHSDAQAFWENTPHADAYHTLEVRDKAFDLECIGCHVTGYQEPGGSTLGFTDGLKDVQCESCHGPGSMHSKAPTQTPAKVNVRRAVPESTCTSCHTPEHSPRFDDARYRARIVGPGHGIAP